MGLLLVAVVLRFKITRGFRNWASGIVVFVFKVSALLGRGLDVDPGFTTPLSLHTTCVFCILRYAERKTVMNQGCYKKPC